VHKRVAGYRGDIEPATSSVEARHMQSREPEDTPSLRQLLHSATGDRDAEARALADRAAEEGDDEVDVDDARLAVRRAQGDLGADDSIPDHDTAVVDDADAAHHDRQN
jgi:hypothetical protein